MRAAIFIDGGYFLQQVKAARVNPDYSEIASHFLAPIRRSVPIDLLRGYFYYCAPWMSPVPSEDEIRRMEAHKLFVEEMESRSRWQVRLGKLEKRWDGTREYFEQKRVDVLLSVDLTRHAAAGHIQHAILVAGDSDFIPAVAAAKESGVTLTLWCGPPNTVHRDLVTLADEVHQLNWKAFPKTAPKPTPPESGSPEAGGPEPKKVEAAPRDRAPAKAKTTTTAAAPRQPRATPKPIDSVKATPVETEALSGHPEGAPLPEAVGNVGDDGQKTTRGSRGRRSRRGGRGRGGSAQTVPPTPEDEA